MNQCAIEIEHYIRLEDGSWRFREYEAGVPAINLESVELELAVADIYEGVDFSLVEPAQSGPAAEQNELLP